MKNIHLGPLTDQFFNNEFSGFNEPVSLGEHILTTNVPIVELDLNIDSNDILNRLDKHTPSEHVVKNYPYEPRPRSQGWHLEILWSDGTVITRLDDVYYKKFADPIPTLEPRDNKKELKEMFLSLGLDIKVCALSVFDSGGYVRPHRDISLNPYPLNYFWIPLTYPIGSELKIYPYGTVDIKLNKLYLMNQENFVHAVRNLSNEKRYVLVGYLNPDISPKFNSTITAAVRKQYNLQ